MADPGFARQDCKCLSFEQKPIIWQFFCGKLCENERNWKHPPMTLLRKHPAGTSVISASFEEIRYYCLQCSCKVMFLHLSVSHSVHRVGVSQHALGQTPLGRHPHGQTYPSMHWPRHPTPQSDISQHALGQTFPLGDSYFCRQYASYSNAFLFLLGFYNGGQ